MDSITTQILNKLAEAAQGARQDLRLAQMELEIAQEQVSAHQETLGYIHRLTLAIRDQGHNLTADGVAEIVNAFFGDAAHRLTVAQSRVHGARAEACQATHQQRQADIGLASREAQYALADKLLRRVEDHC